MRELELRAAAAADLDDIVALLRQAGLPFEDLATASLRDFLVARDAAGTLLAAGGVERYGASGLLRSVVVSDAARGRGLGASLVSALERHAGASGVGELYLLTTTAAGWFPRLGYTPRDRAGVPPGVAQSAEFAALCPASAVCLGKTLQA